MKTALTQMIEIVETAFELKNNPAWQQIFESHLEAEKEQIMEAFKIGELRTGYTPEQYYQQTCKTYE